MASPASWLWIHTKFGGIFSGTGVTPARKETCNKQEKILNVDLRSLGVRVLLWSFCNVENIQKSFCFWKNQPQYRFKSVEYISVIIDHHRRHNKKNKQLREERVYGPSTTKLNWPPTFSAPTFYEVVRWFRVERNCSWNKMRSFVQSEKNIQNKK